MESETTFVENTQGLNILLGEMNKTTDNSHNSNSMVSQNHGNCDTTSPDIVNVHTQTGSALADEKCSVPLAIDSEARDDENVQLPSLISSFLSATDDLAREIKKDLSLDTILTQSSKTSGDPKLMEMEEQNLLNAVSPQAEYLDSFNISVDEKRTTASYVELLQSYQAVFQKWQASEIQSQLKDLQILLL